MKKSDGFFLAAILLAAGLLVGSRAAFEPLDHDEHQFVVAGVLLARQGLLPYRDYPYFHTPYLIFADALLFRLAGPTCRLLLLARGLSCACALGTTSLIAGSTLHRLRHAPVLTRRIACAAATLLLIGNPIFSGATGRSWNHDAAGFLLTAATLLFLPMNRSNRRFAISAGSAPRTDSSPPEGTVRRADSTILPMNPWRALSLRRGVTPDRGKSYSEPNRIDPNGPKDRLLRPLLVGVLLGLAIGVRLTVAPAAGAFAGWLLATPVHSWRHRLQSCLMLFLGLVVALLPCIWLWRLAPHSFLFGNFRYPVLNTAYRIANGSLLSTTTPQGKIVYCLNRLLFSGNVCLIGMIVLVAFRRSRFARRDESSMRRELQFLLVLTLFLLAGAVAPSPLFLVYFYLPVPILILWLCRAAEPILGAECSRGALRWVAGTFLAGALIASVRTYQNVFVLLHPARWTPMVVHEQGVAMRRELRGTSSSGPVLTLMPILPLEAGLTIYPELATGAFAFRVAPGVATAERRELNLIGPDDLARLCRRTPPLAVLPGGEGRRADAAMIKAAGARPIVHVRETEPTE